MKFKSKINFAIVIPFVLLIVGIFAFAVWEGQNVIPAIFSGACIYYASGLLNTYYEIKHGQLKIRSGFVVHRSIPIEQVFKIKRVIDFISAPALSHKRLEIFYEQESIQISPVDQEIFIEELLKVKPQIAVE